VALAMLEKEGQERKEQDGVLARSGFVRGVDESAKRNKTRRETGVCNEQSGEGKERQNSLVLDGSYSLCVL
jgi:hypothetical protein